MLRKQKSNASPESMARTAHLVSKEGRGKGGPPGQCQAQRAPLWSLALTPVVPFPGVCELHPESGGMPFTLDISKPTSQA